MSAFPATQPQKLGPARADKLGRHLYPNAHAVEYLNKPGRGEMLIVREGNLVRLIDYKNLDNRNRDSDTEGDPQAA